MCSSSLCFFSLFLTCFSLSPFVCMIDCLPSTDTNRSFSLLTFCSCIAQMHPMSTVVHKRGIMLCAPLGMVMIAQPSSLLLPAPCHPQGAPPSSSLIPTLTPRCTESRWPFHVRCYAVGATSPCLRFRTTSMVIVSLSQCPHPRQRPCSFPTHPFLSFQTKGYPSSSVWTSW